jgi:hypothetical protein
MDQERRPDDRFARIREALVALRLASADDRQEQARLTVRVLEVERAIARGEHPGFEAMLRAEAERLLAP